MDSMWNNLGSANWWLGDSSFFGQAMETMGKHGISFLGFGASPKSPGLGLTQEHWTLMIGIGAFYLLAKK